MSRPITSKIVWDTKNQLERVQKAAKALNWSLNRYLIEAAKERADKTLFKAQSANNRGTGGAV